MLKNKIKIPKYTSRPHASKQAAQALRMPSRCYVDKKKKQQKYCCRGVY